MPKTYDGDAFGRGHKPGEPAGAAWNALRARLWQEWTGGGVRAAVCYHCGHDILPGLGEVQHLLSPSTHPGLAMTEYNLRPAHGGGRRRCPDCWLACNSVAAGNAAVRDAEGRPLPFTPAFIKAAQARTAAGKSYLPRPRTGRNAGGDRDAGTARDGGLETRRAHMRTDPPDPAGPQRQADEGRDWDAMAPFQVDDPLPTAPATGPEPLPGSPEWYARNYPEW